MLIVSTILASLDSVDPQFGDQDGPSSAPDFDFSGFYKILPIAVYANIFHHSLPGLSYPVANKALLSKIYRSVFAFMTVAYCLIGCMASSYFGSNILR